MAKAISITLLTNPTYIPHTLEEQKRYQQKVATRLEHIEALFRESGWTEAYRDVFYVYHYLREMWAIVDDKGRREKPLSDPERDEVGKEEENAIFRGMGQIARENLLPESSYKVVERYLKRGLTWEEFLLKSMAETQLEAAVRKAIENGNLAVQSGGEKPAEIGKLEGGEMANRGKDNTQNSLVSAELLRPTSREEIAKACLLLGDVAGKIGKRIALVEPDQELFDATQLPTEITKRTKRPNPEIFKACLLLGDVAGKIGKRVRFVDIPAESDRMGEQRVIREKLVPTLIKGLENLAEKRTKYINNLFKQTGWTEAYKNVFYVLYSLRELLADSLLYRRAHKMRIDDYTIAKLGLGLKMMPRDYLGYPRANEERDAVIMGMAQIEKEHLLLASGYKVVEEELLYDPKAYPSEIPMDAIVITITQLEAAVQAAIEKAKSVKSGGKKKPRVEAKVATELYELLKKILVKNPNKPSKKYSREELIAEVERRDYKFTGKAKNNPKAKQQRVSNALSALRNEDYNITRGRAIQYLPSTTRQ